MQTSGATNCIEVLLATAQMRWGPPAHGAPQLQPSGWMRQVLGALLVSSGVCVLMHFFAQPLLSVIFIFLLALGVWSHFAKGKCFWHFFHHVSITCCSFNTNGVIKHFTRPLYQRIVIKEKVQCLTWKVSNEFHSDSGWWFLPSRN